MNAPEKNYRQGKMPSLIYVKGIYYKFHVRLNKNGFDDFDYTSYTRSDLVARQDARIKELEAALLEAANDCQFWTTWPRDTVANKYRAIAGGSNETK